MFQIILLIGKGLINLLLLIVKLPNVQSVNINYLTKVLIIVFCSFVWLRAHIKDKY